MAVQNIQTLLREKSFPKPIYVLHGEEEYFIDVVTHNAEENVIAADQRSFNQNVFFGTDCKLGEVMNACQQFSMLGGRQLVLVKEAQKLDSIFREEGAAILLRYLANPVAHTCLVLSIKGKKIDGKTKLAKELATKECLFLSEEIKDYAIPKWIEEYVKRDGINISPAVANDINERIGNDLHRIASEVEKLLLTNNDIREITQQMVEQNISKVREYNVFDFKKAIIGKNFSKAFEIAEYFGSFQKSGDAIGTFAMLSSFITKCYAYSQLIGSSRAEAYEAAGIAAEFMAKDFESMHRVYHLRGIKSVIEALLDADISLKGADDLAMELTGVYNNFVIKCLEAATPN